MNVTLKITDVICNNCFKNSMQKEVVVTSSTQTIELQLGYTLNVIDFNENSSTVLIQNGTNSYIRIIYEFETQLILNSNNKTKHVLLLSSITN